MSTSVRQCCAMQRGGAYIILSNRRGPLQDSFEELRNEPGPCSKIVLRNRALGDDSEIEFLQL